MANLSVRYFVDDVDAAIGFYCQHLGFVEEMHPAPGFAMLSRGNLRLLLSAGGQAGGPGGGSQAMPDGRVPEPGGWNRFTLEVTDLAAAVEGSFFPAEVGLNLPLGLGFARPELSVMRYLSSVSWAIGPRGIARRW